MFNLWFRPSHIHSWVFGQDPGRHSLLTARDNQMDVDTMLFQHPALLLGLIVFAIIMLLLQFMAFAIILFLIRRGSTESRGILAA